MKKSKLFAPNRVGNAKKFINSKRKNSQDLYNSKDWTNYRFRFLHYNPQCYICPDKSEVVDHVLAHKGDVSLFESNKNHIPLCSAHHNYVTAKYDRNDNPDTVGKLEYFKVMREQNAINIRVKVIPYRK